MGSTYEMACNFAGISYQTFRNWMMGGEKGTGKYADLYQAVKQAEGRAAVGWLAKIEKAANEGHWQAAAWKLERRYPREYGRTTVDVELSAAESYLAALKEFGRGNSGN